MEHHVTTLATTPPFLIYARPIVCEDLTSSSTSSAFASSFTPAPFHQPPPSPTPPSTPRLCQIAPRRSHSVVSQHRLDLTFSSSTQIDSASAIDAMTLGFLDLPPELRLKIYRSCFFGGTVGRRAHEYHQNLSSQLLRTCKTCAIESLPILYGENKFIVPRGPKRALEAIGSNVSLVKHLKFYSNDWRRNDRTRQDIDDTLDAMLACKSLKSMEVWVTTFPSPASYGDVFDHTLDYSKHSCQIIRLLKIHVLMLLQTAEQLVSRGGPKSFLTSVSARR